MRTSKTNENAIIFEGREVDRLIYRKKGFNNKPAGVQIILKNGEQFSVKGKTFVKGYEVTPIALWNKLLKYVK